MAEKVWEQGCMVVTTLSQHSSLGAKKTLVITAAES